EPMNGDSAASGLSLLESEMSRQHGDALASFEQGRVVAERIAESLGRTGRLLLVGMGGSHYVNRAVEAAYRAHGIDATALVASELLAAPLPDRPRTAILTSQSGASGEILRLLAVSPGREERFGLTLEASSPLARQLPSLIGVGGTERAFAATRSLMMSFALQAAVLALLGEPVEAGLQSLHRPLLRPVGAAVEMLAGKRAVIVSGRGAMAGLAEAGALSLMELA